MEKINIQRFEYDIITKQTNNNSLNSKINSISVDNCEIFEFDVESNTNKKINYGEKGEITSIYTIENGIEKGTNYTGEAGSEVASGGWEIVYTEDGLNYKSQKLFDENGGLISIKKYF